MGNKLDVKLHFCYFFKIHPARMYLFQLSTYFFAGQVFCKFHIFKVWSSEAVINTDSIGWKARLLIPSKWLLKVNLGFQVFLRASLLFAIYCNKNKN